MLDVIFLSPHIFSYSHCYDDDTLFPPSPSPPPPPPIPLPPFPQAFQFAPCWAHIRQYTWWNWGNTTQGRDYTGKIRINLQPGAGIRTQHWNCEILPAEIWVWREIVLQKRKLLIRRGEKGGPCWLLKLVWMGTQRVQIKESSSVGSLGLSCLGCCSRHWTSFFSHRLNYLHSFVSIAQQTISRQSCWVACFLVCFSGTPVQGVHRKQEQGEWSPGTWLLWKEKL